MLQFCPTIIISICVIELELTILDSIVFVYFVSERTQARRLTTNLHPTSAKLSMQCNNWTRLSCSTMQKCWKIKNKIDINDKHASATKTGRRANAWTAFSMSPSTTKNGKHTHTLTHQNAALETANGKRTLRVKRKQGESASEEKLSGRKWETSLNGCYKLVCLIIKFSRYDYQHRTCCIYATHTHNHN